MKKSMQLTVIAFIIGLILVGNVSGQTGGKTASFIKLLESGTYFMKASVTSEGTTAIVETYAKDGKMAVVSSVEGMSTRSVIKDRKTYMIMDSLKMVMVMPFTGTNEISKVVVDKMKLTGSGIAKFNGKDLPYDEYSNPDGIKIQYFIDGNKLAGIRSIAKEGSADLVIIELNQNVPNSIFDIPTGYQVQEMPKL